MTEASLMGLNARVQTIASLVRLHADLAILKNNSAYPPDSTRTKSCQLAKQL
jgi:hypothetical protein